MKNKIIILSSVILAIFLGYLSGLVVDFNPSDNFIERRSEVKIIDTKTRLYYVLPSDAYLLRFKHTVGKAQNKQIILNGSLISRDAYMGVRTKRVLQTEYIYLPKKTILPKENTLDIYIPDDKPDSIDVVLSNYRRNINNDIYVLFSDANWKPAKGAITGFIVFYALFLPAFFLLMIFLIKNIAHLGINKSLLYQLYSIAPLLLFLVGVNLFNLFNETFNIVISFRYLLIIGILPIFIIEFCLIMNKLLKNKEGSNIALSSSVYFIKKILLFVKDWLEKKEYSNAFIMGGIIFLALCPIFLILGSEPLTEQLAIIAYILLAIGVVIKLFNLKGKNQGRIKKK